jgi:hypothetical protein
MPLVKMATFILCVFSKIRKDHAYLVMIGRMAFTFCKLMKGKMPSYGVWRGVAGHRRQEQVFAVKEEISAQYGLRVDTVFSVCLEVIRVLTTSLLYTKGEVLQRSVQRYYVFP